MDLNIGSALWCAAHAAGRLRFPQLPTWRSAARLRGAQVAANGSDISGQQEQASAAAAGHDGSRTAAETPAAPEAAAAAGAASGGEEALWRPAGEGARYRSCARVALLGHGADEQCGGYGRHRTTFRHQVHSCVTRSSTAHRLTCWQSRAGRMLHLVHLFDT